MMKNIYYFVLPIFLLSLFNCKTFNRSEFLNEEYPKIEKESFIVEFDENSLEELYLHYSIRDNQTIINHLNLKNEKIQYAKRLILIAREKYSTSNWNWWVFLVCPPFNPLFYLGFPVASDTAKITFEGYVVGKQNNIINKYTANGENTEYQALYWGYNKDDVYDPANYGAIINSLTNLRRQIENDYK